MKDKTERKRFSSERRQKRVRKKVRGTPEKPRLTVSKSLNHISAQLIDDLSHRTLLGVSSLTPEFMKELTKEETKTQIAKKIGLYLASMAKGKGIVQVVFDRNKYVYHGRVKALAEGAREGGLKF
jgi:large subunit ribosomal protein L18